MKIKYVLIALAIICAALVGAKVVAAIWFKATRTAAVQMNAAP